MKKWCCPVVWAVNLVLLILLIVLLVKTNYIQQWQQRHAPSHPVQLDHYSVMLSEHRWLTSQLESSDRVFVGDSILQGWKLSSLGPNTLNLGIAGDTFIGVLDRISPALVTRANHWYLAIGTNDLLLGHPLDQIEQMIQKAKVLFSGARHFYWQTILPVDSQRYETHPLHKIVQINQWIEQACHSMAHCQLIEYPKEFDQPRALDDYFLDGLHLNEQGYRLLTQTVKQQLSQSVQPNF